MPNVEVAQKVRRFRRWVESSFADMSQILQILQIKPEEPSDVA